MTAKPSAPEKVRVILYTRPGCHLCDDAKEAMIAAGCADEYTLDEVNIESEPGLLRSYRHEIPVVLINGLEAFRHRVVSQEFREHVAKAGQSASDILQK
jgi:glutaredoxin